MLSHENTSSFADGFPTAGTMARHFVRTAKTKGDGFLLTLRLFSRYDVPGIRLTFDAGSTREKRHSPRAQSQFHYARGATVLCPEVTTSSSLSLSFSSGYARHRK